MPYNIGKRHRRPHLKEQQWEWRGGNEFEKYLEGSKVVKMMMREFQGSGSTHAGQKFHLFK